MGQQYHDPVRGFHHQQITTNSMWTRPCHAQVRLAQLVWFAGMREVCSWERQLSFSEDCTTPKCQKHQLFGRHQHFQKISISTIYLLHPIARWWQMQSDREAQQNLEPLSRKSRLEQLPLFHVRLLMSIGPPIRRPIISQSMRYLQGLADTLGQDNPAIFFLYL